MLSVSGEPAGPVVSLAGDVETSGAALTVADDGRGGPSGQGSGHGLVGMRERAALFGGTLTAGPRAGHGFEVRAVLPYGEERSA